MKRPISLTKRLRKRKLKNGAVVEQLRYVVSHRDPVTNKRRQEFFERQKDAQAHQAKIMLEIGNGSYVDYRSSPTVGQAIDHWYENKRGRVKANTFEGYSIVIENIRGPLLVGTQKQRAEFTAHEEAAARNEVITYVGSP